MKLIFSAILLTTLFICNISFSQTNVALNKPVSSSNYHQPTNPPENAVDGSLSTMWRTYAWDYHFITIDLEANYNISKIKLHWGPHYAYHYVINVSCDGINWGYYEYTIVGSGGLEEFTTPVSGRYIQLYCLNSATGQGFSVNEIEIYGTLSAYSNFTSSNLPIVLIETNGQEIIDDPKIIADFKLIDNLTGINNVNDLPYYEGKIGIELRGRSSQILSPKKSFGFNTIDENGEDFDVSLMGMPEEHSWILNANYFDKTLIRNSISYHLWEKMGYYSSRAKHCELVVNGQYMGIYVFQERIKRDSNRLAIKKLEENDNSGLELTGGYIIKVDYNYDDNNSWESEIPPPHNNNGQKINFLYHYPKAEVITQAQKNYIKSYVDSVEAALYNDDFTSFRNLANETSFIDYFIVEELSKNVDGYRSSTFLYKDRDDRNGKLTMGPIWDYDIAYKNASYCNATNPSGWMYIYCDPNDEQQVPFWWSKLMTDNNFKNNLRCRWKYLRENILTLNYINNWIDSTANLLNESKDRNFERWPILNQWLWNSSAVFGTYQEEVNYLKNWFAERIIWLDNNIPGQCTNNNNLNSLFINEFMASNNQTIADINGNYEDWIEIFNAGNEVIDIAGFYITDNLTNLVKHQIPYGYEETKIHPGEFKLLWADGEGNASPLHLSFKLSADGEAIGIINPVTLSFIDSISFGAQQTDISFGRYEDGEDNWLIFTQPTPGASNIYNQPPIVTQGLFINEFMASNGSTIADEYGNYEDWIEIYNSTNQNIDLAGYFITDNLSNFLKYQIPYGYNNTTIPPNGFLLIWADGASDLGPLHTSFKLSASGEAVGLMHPDGITVLDSITFGQQDKDISYGRIIDGHPEWKFFFVPTPNASNHSNNINKHIYDEFIIFPNPMQNLINVKFSNSKSYNIKIINIFGQILYEKDYNTSIVNIDVSTFSKGIYTLIISDGTNTHIKKLTKN